LARELAFPRRARLEIRISRHAPVLHEGVLRRVVAWMRVAVNVLRKLRESQVKMYEECVLRH
jgi:hypothetical protein